MAVIKISQFGGEMPSASSRAIPAGQARRAFNLLARVNEFRPLNKDTVKTTKAIMTAAGLGASFAEDGATLYRFSVDSAGNPITDDTLGWVSALPATNYVKGQINDSQTERVYLSSLDGSIAPTVIDATGVGKPIGVPPPASAPGVTHNIGNEYSVDEDAAARKSIPIALASTAKTSLSTIAIGTAPSNLPSVGVSGWLAHGASGVTGTLPSTALGDHNFLIPTVSSGGAATDPTQSWIMAVEFGGKAVGYGGGYFWAVPVTMQGRGYLVNQTTLATGIKQILNPDVEARTSSPASGYTYAGQLVTDATANTAAANVAADFAQTTAPQANDIAALEVSFNKLVKAVTDYGNNTSIASTVTAFYSGTAVATEITAAIANFANDIRTAEAAIVAAPVYMTSMDTFSDPAWSSPTLTDASAIISEVGTCLGFAADGTKVLNTETLRAWLRSTIEAVIGNIYPSPGDTPIKSMKDKIAASVDPVLSRLETTLSGYASRALAGSPSQTNTNTDRAGSVLTAISNLRYAAHKVTSDYETVFDRLTDTVRNIFDAEGGIAQALNSPVTRLVDTRFYVATLVTSWGEESSPGPVSAMLNVDQNDTVTVTRPTELADSAVVATYLLTGWRLYRSNVGSAGTAFQLVADLPLATTSYTDSLKGAELQEVLPTTTWLPPPVNYLPSKSSDVVQYSANNSTWHSTFTAGDMYRRRWISGSTYTASAVMNPYLRGVTGMANGIMAGFFDNTVCFSEAFVPYSWPVEYQLTTKHAIVGMGSFGNSLFVGTKGIPYIFTGTDPASMSPQELPGNQACVSARSIASFENGVLYASPDGICQADYGGVKVLTQGLFTKDDWIALNPSSIVGVMHHGVYYFLYDGRATTTPPQSQAVTIGMDPTAVQTAVTALFIELKTLIWNGAEPAAIALYNAKQLEFGFTDAEFAPYTAFTAAQITAWKTSTGAADVEAAFKALYAGLKQMIWEGNELLAKAVYNQKQLAYGFTDEQFHHFTDFSAAQIGEWKSNYIITPVANATGQWPNKVIRAAGCYALDFVTGKLTEVDIQGTAFFVNIETDTLYMLDGTDIKALFVDTTQKRTGEYWTGLIKLDKPAPFAWLQVDSVFTTAATIKWYGDGVLRHTASVTTNAPVRLPAGVYLEHQIMIESVDRITMVTLASSTQELQSA